MTGRRRLAVSLVTLLTVGTSFVLPTREPAQAAEPTLEQAIAQQRRLEQTLAEQRAQLEQLGSTRSSLESTLAQAEAELGRIAAEYDTVTAMLAEVRLQIADVEAQLEALVAQIAELDAELQQVAADIERRTAELEAREALFEEHMREAYERSQTSILEVLLAAPTLEQMTNQVGYLLGVADRDRELADGIREIRAELRAKRQTLADGRRQADAARAEAEEQAAELAARQQDLADMEAQLAELRAQADAYRAEQAYALEQIRLDEERAEELYADNVAAHAAQEQLVQQLQAEAERRAREAEEARRREEERRARDASARAGLSAAGFRWPMDHFVVTQEFGATGVWLEPPAYYKGVYYQHFHEGIDIAGPCGLPIYAASAGVVVASGQPNPASTGFGVVIAHGAGIQTWYWHLSPQVVVFPGQQVATGQLVGYEGNTGYSTGCHLHFAINVNGEWENPRAFLP